MDNVKTTQGLYVKLGKNWVILFLFLLCIIFSFAGKGFFANNTLNNVLMSSSPSLLLAAGETFVIITGGIDLSIGFVKGMVSVIAAIVMRNLFTMGYSPFFSISLGIIVGLLIGLLPGLLNGVLVAKFRVPPFIATLGMYGIANGIAFGLCDGFPIIDLPQQAGRIGNGYILYHFSGLGFSFFKPPEGILDSQLRDLVRILPNSILISGIIIAIFGYILTRTQFGQHTYAIGGNIDAARRAGINVDSHLIKIYTISSFFGALAGVLSVLVYSIGSHTQFSASLELFAVAAVVIGGASLKGGKGSIWGSFLGVMVLTVLEIGFLMSGVFPFYRYIAVGSILVLAVIIDQTFPEFIYD
ncbi:MAG TPA: ABC transporter permease [Candidatus Atribacteria bacterium]|jgi:ribose/xylose/arabinose/galactoside ABC-type transport system permease subunit|nr:ABC transporter permease [Candidatus Atribacteria bacterium]